MARTDDDRPRGRFAKSGHTRHVPGVAPQPATPPPGVAVPSPGAAASAATRRVAPMSPAGEPPAQDFGAPTYHHTPSEAAPPPGGGRSKTVVAGSATRAAAHQTNRAARAVTHKVINASKAGGADESGLTALVWNQVLSYGTDAMITVALASTVFFGASTNAQRGNVLLYLLITMAPFAVVAPVIGPVLDRLAHGRRWTMAGTAAGRAALALIMAAHSTQLLVLYPCALGSLVFSKAYGVVRASAAPRLVPRGMTLTEANARLSIFGLGSTLVLGGFVGGLIKVSGSYSLGLIVSAIGFVACAVFAVRLPHQVDSAPAGPAPRRTGPPQPAAGPSPGSPAGPRSTAPAPAHPPRRRLTRLLGWARRGYSDGLITAVQGQSALRLLNGLLTIYLAFYIESTAHGWEAAAQLGAMVAAAGGGNAIGTAAGTRIRLARPDLVIIVGTIAAAATCLLVALAFDIGFAIAGMLIAAVCNSLCKIALDSMIQRDVAERMRSSAFGRSETFLQLAWVIGAAIGVGLPSDRHVGGALGFWVAFAILGSAAAVVTLRHRALSRAAGGPAQ